MQQRIEHSFSILFLFTQEWSLTDIKNLFCKSVLAYDRQQHNYTIADENKEQITESLTIKNIQNIYSRMYLLPSHLESL